LQDLRAQQGKETIGMSLQSGRFPLANASKAADGWTLERLTPPSALYGANGMRVGPDGRIYVAQVAGSQISAIDIDSGQVEAVSKVGGDIVAPDDLVFGANGEIYATEVMNERVAVRDASGRTRVLRGDLPMANGITWHKGRLFVDESRHGGRVMELDLNGGPPKVLVDNIPTGNALEIGPDGMLYFPVMEANEIWRVNPDGGAVEKVAGDLGVPDAVKFDSKGFIVSTQVASGQVLRIDPRTGSKELLAQLESGLDNLVFVGERLFVSAIRGTIVEILPGGQVKPLLGHGMAWPMGLAVGDDGQLYICDGPFFLVLGKDGVARTVGTLFTPGYPGYTRGVANLGGGEFAIATGGPHVARFRPFEQQMEVIADGFEELYGVAAAPGGAVVFADGRAGRVLSAKDGEVEELARGLAEPKGVATAPDGSVFVAEAAGGRVVKLAGGKAETVMDGLATPHGLAVSGGKLYVVDAGAKTVTEADLSGGSRRTIATDLPVGAPSGVTPKPLNGFPPFSGVMGSFTGLAAGPDGSLYVACDGDGSILALRPS
jgi:sugar lactone lactonase YvrE